MKEVIPVEESIKKKIKNGFTVARWGMDLCIGALFIAAALIISAVTGDVSLIKVLVIPVIMCVIGIIVFAAGRTVVGLQSRKLNLHTSRPLDEEEIWFVSCMLEIEEKGAGASFYSSAARMTGGTADNMAAGAMAGKIVGRFFRIGRHFMDRNILLNRLPAIISFAAAIIIVIMNVN